MRPLEIVVSCLVLLAAITSMSDRLRRIALGLWLLSLVSVLLHVFLEGPRLQAAPIYFGLIAGFALTRMNVPGPGFIRVAASLVVCGCVAVGMLACYVYPVFQLPRPTGPYSIGTKTFYLTDSSREERYGQQPGQKRRVAFQVWYPASSCTGKTAIYREPRTLIWKSAHLRYVKTHACPDAPAVTPPQRWPVVFFSP